MQGISAVEELPANKAKILKPARPGSPLGIATAMLTGCQDRHYAFGLAMALAKAGASVDVIGSDEIDSPELHTTANLRFLNFRPGHSSDSNFARKLGEAAQLLRETRRICDAPRTEDLAHFVEL